MGNKKIKIRFITYGDRRFIKSRTRITNEAKKLNFFDVLTTYTEKHVSKIKCFKTAMETPSFAKVYNHPRGGGYWMWKPLVILEELEKMDNEDILFYSDAGLTISNELNTIKKFKEYKDVVNNHDTGICTWRNIHIESKWTKADIFDHFNVLDNPEFHSTRQCSGNRHVIRKCDESVEIIRTWWSTAVDHPHLFSDQPSKIPNFNNFIENRHDQSVWSMIAKMHNVAQRFDWYNDNPILLDDKKRY